MQDVPLSQRFQRYDIQAWPDDPSLPHGYSYPVELRVDLSRERLIWRWTYSAAIFKLNQIERLAERVSESLEKFVSISPKTRW